MLFKRGLPETLAYQLFLRIPQRDRSDLRVIMQEFRGMELDFKANSAVWTEHLKELKAMRFDRSSFLATRPRDNKETSKAESHALVAYNESVNAMGEIITDTDGLQMRDVGDSRICLKCGNPEHSGPCTEPRDQAAINYVYRKRFRRDPPGWTSNRTKQLVGRKSMIITKSAFSKLCEQAGIESAAVAKITGNHTKTTKPKKEPTSKPIVFDAAFLDQLNESSVEEVEQNKVAFAVDLSESKDMLYEYVFQMQHESRKATSKTYSWELPGGEAAREEFVPPRPEQVRHRQELERVFEELNETEDMGITCADATHKQFHMAVLLVWGDQSFPIFAVGDTGADNNY
ncbi:MAG: hypothetical protein AAF802_33435, partial [Planctomycetota bacterium]